jgi:hypothetical protein
MEIDETGIDDDTNAVVRAELAALLKPLIRPVSYITLKKTRAPADQRMRSHFGGLPYLEEGDEWPRDAGNKAMELVFQVFQDEAGSIALPPDVRLIQFFESDEECYAVVFTAITGEAARIAPPPDAVVRPYQVITFAHAVMLPELYTVYDRISRRTAMQWGEEAAASSPSDLIALCPEAAALFKKLKYDDLWWEQDLDALDLGASGPHPADYLGGYPCTVPDNQAGNGFLELNLPRGRRRVPGVRWRHLFQLVWKDAVENSFAENGYYQPESGEIRCTEQEPAHIYDEDGYVSTDEGF